MAQIVTKEEAMLTYIELAKKYGTVRFNGKVLALTQHAYAWNSLPIYGAFAIDEEENHYQVTWRVINQDCEDESQACDWNEYKVRRL